MTPDQLDRAIKESSMDTSGFTMLRTPCPVLRSGSEFDRIKAAALPHAGPGYTHVKAFDYEAHMPGWPHGQLINFYYDNETDPRTTLECFRVWSDGRVERT